MEWEVKKAGFGAGEIVGPGDRGNRRAIHGQIYPLGPDSSEAERD